MNIAICDDQAIQCKEIFNLVSQYCTDKKVSINVDTFTSAKSFLKSSKCYSIVLMDIELKNENGMEVIKEYKKNNDSIIIFISSHDEELPNGYKVKALRFIVKPIQISILYEALDSAIKEINSENKLTVLDNEKIVVIKESSIIYVEAGNRSVGVRTLTGFYKLMKSINQVYLELNSLLFYMPHRSYIVNMDYISEICKNEIILLNRERIQISRLRMKEFLNKFHEFIGSKIKNG